MAVFDNLMHLAEIRAELDTKVTNSFTANRAIISNEYGELAAINTTSTELTHLVGIQGNIQTQLNEKVTNDFTASRAIISNEYGKLAVVNTTSTELMYLSGVESNVQDQLSKKVTNNFTAKRAIMTDSNGHIAASGVTSTELNYLSGVTSNIQTQFNNVGSILQAAPTAQGSIANNGVMISLNIPKGGKWIITGYAGGHKILLKTDDAAVYRYGTNPLVFASSTAGALTIKMVNGTGSSQTIYADGAQYYIVAIRIG